MNSFVFNTFNNFVFNKIAWDFFVQNFKRTILNKATFSKRVFCVLVLFVISFQLFASDQLYGQSIKVGVYDNPPLTFIDENQDAQGVFIDIINFIAEKENIQVEYIAAEWPVLLEYLHTGRIDILPNITHVGNPNIQFDFSELPVLTSWLELFSKYPSEFSSLADLDGKNIGVLRCTMDENFLADYMQDNASVNFKTILFGSTTEMYDALANKKIDAFIANRYFKFSELCRKQNLSSNLAFRPFGLHFAFARNAQSELLIELFNKEVLELVNTDGSIYYESLRSHLGAYYENYIPKYYLWINIILSGIILMAFISSLIITHYIKVKNKSLKISNQSLIVAAKQAEESDRLKSAFLQNISHEIRTPLNGILGFVDLLATPDLTEDTSAEFREIIKNSGARLLDTVNDIIEISKIESGDLDVKDTTINLFQLMKSIKDFFLIKANNKNIELVLGNTLMFENELIIRSDQTKIEGILTNLVNNAIKFTEKGKIEMGCFLDNTNITFYVKDTGKGIPVEKQKIIFERFRQTDEMLSRDHEGAGLGLAIAKSYVEALKGKIWVKSLPGNGSTFFFSIPYTPLKTSGNKEGTLVLPPKNSTILIAEDDDISFLYLKTALKQDGFDVIRAENGEKAVQAVLKNPKISLVLMDIRMPIMNGFEAAEKIREFNENVPIIAQTAYGYLKDQKMATRYGCSDYISKPMKYENLRTLIAKYLISYSQKAV